MTACALLIHPVQAATVSRMERDRLRMAILEEASIVCTTLAFSGGNSFARLVRKFDVVVVDEAAQAVEPSVLVPLAHGGAKQVFLVGDPEQLPATVMSSVAVAQGYDKSLFKRLQQAGYPVQVRRGAAATARAAQARRPQQSRLDHFLPSCCADAGHAVPDAPHHPRVSLHQLLRGLPQGRAQRAGGHGAAMAHPAGLPAAGVLRRPQQGAHLF